MGAVSGDGTSSEEELEECDDEARQLVQHRPIHPVCQSTHRRTHAPAIAAGARRTCCGTGRGGRGADAVGTAKP